MLLEPLAFLYAYGCQANVHVEPYVYVEPVSLYGFACLHSANTPSREYTHKARMKQCVGTSVFIYFESCRCVIFDICTAPLLVY